MTRPPDPPPLARAVISHLRLELESVAKLNAALTDLRRAAVDGDAHVELLRRAVAESQHDLRESRNLFRETVADRPVAKIIDELPEPWAGAARELRLRILADGAETRRLARRLILVLRFCDSAAKRLLARAGGWRVERYGADGARLTDPLAGAA